MTLVRRHVHADPLVLSTAQSLAQEMFVAFMREPKGRGNELFARLRAAHPDASVEEIERRFVTRMSPHLLGEARATLARLLADPSKSSLHPAIGDALLRDHTLRRGRVRI